MYLEIWMMVTLVVAFGACAWYCTSVGVKAGISAVLQQLESEKIIRINKNTGKITPGRG